MNRIKEKLAGIGQVIRGSFLTLSGAAGVVAGLVILPEDLNVAMVTLAEIQIGEFSGNPVVFIRIRSMAHLRIVPGDRLEKARQDIHNYEQCANRPSAVRVTSHFRLAYFIGRCQGPKSSAQ